MSRSDSPDPLLPAAASTPSRERALRTALKGAKRVLKRRFRVLLLVRDAYDRADENDRSIHGVRTDLKALLRLLKAWALRQYQRVPWPSLLLLAGAVVYFVMPVDMIPDMLPAIGFIDDVAVVSTVVHALRDELERFRAWETGRLDETPSSTSLISHKTAA